MVWGLLNSMKSCPYCGAQYPEDAVTCAADGHPLDRSTESPQQSGGTVSGVRCPACGAGDYSATVELRGSFSWPVFFAGGIFAVLFRNAGSRRKVRCNHCKAVFEVRTPLSRVSLVLLWLLICPTIIGIVLLMAAFLYAVFSG